MFEERVPVAAAAAPRRQGFNAATNTRKADSEVTNKSLRGLNVMRHGVVALAT